MVRRQLAMPPPPEGTGSGAAADAEGAANVDAMIAAAAEGEEGEEGEESAGAEAAATTASGQEEGGALQDAEVGEEDESMPMPINMPGLMGGRGLGGRGRGVPMP